MLQCKIATGLELCPGAKRASIQIRLLTEPYSSRYQDHANLQGHLTNNTIRDLWFKFEVIRTSQMRIHTFEVPVRRAHCAWNWAHRALRLGRYRGVTEGPHIDIAGQFVVPDGEEAGVLNAADMKKLENNERAMRELRSGLGPDVSHHIVDAKSAKEMWDNLELRFGGDKVLYTSKVQEILADFGNFKQEENESLEACSERLSNMIYTIDKYGETRSQQELNIKFLYSLRKEWRPIMLMVKSYENIEKYKLAALYNLLKSHEPDVVGRRSEMAGSVPLALVSKEDEE
ncbi:hypothetical protein L2E82_30212 [Cichorium intybus]|uniref:Uncharacterized protein n=1 Tax=Cichorium intybus TaxID=13427 RepID=A0ACB9CZR4_CICIN|nr:hypothetical protein L2E82_30212 [Cichorium intybus]